MRGVSVIWGLCSGYGFSLGEDAKGHPDTVDLRGPKQRA